MKFQTTRFGELTIPSDKIYIFPEGLLGFSNCNKFTFVNEEESRLKMMQSLDNPSLAFIVIDPLLFFPEYNFKITKLDLNLVKAEAIEDLSVYNIVTMASDIRDATVNLQGPIVIHSNKRIGHQFVLYDTEYSTREKLIQEDVDLGALSSSTENTGLQQKTG